MRVYKLNDFLKYPNLAFQMAMIFPFSWSGAIRSKWQKSAFRKLWFMFGAFSLVYQNFGMLIYLFMRNINDKSAFGHEQVSVIVKISETGAIMGLTIVAACKMFMLFFQRKRCEALLEDLQKLFPNEYLQLKYSHAYRAQYYAKKSELLMKRTTIFFLAAFCYYNLLPIMEIYYQWSKSKGKVLYRYQSNTWYPWQNEQNQASLIGFIAAYACQVQSSLTGVAFIMAGEFMLCFFITQMQLHFDVLSTALRELNSRDGILATNQLKAIIGYHNKLLRCAIEINKIFNGSFLVNFITATIAICLMSFSMIMISPLHALKYSIGLLTFLVFTFFICYIGNQLTDASSKLLSAAFYNNWYHGDVAFRKMLIVLIIRSGKPCVLRVFNFTSVSIFTFMTIIKISFQLFTFIKAIV